MTSPPGGVRDRIRRSPASVAILRWPVDASRRPDLLLEDRPCLWLLHPGELVPDLGPSEDWVRLPVDERDLHARVQRLAARTHGPGVLLPGEVAVDAEGLLTFGDRRVIVPAVESIILNRLGERAGEVVSRDDLAAHVWRGHGRGDRALDSRIHTLRSRIAPLGLTVHTVRGRGYLLAVLPDPPNEPVRRASARRSPWSNS